MLNQQYSFVYVGSDEYSVFVQFILAVASGYSSWHLRVVNGHMKLLADLMNFYLMHPKIVPTIMFATQVLTIIPYAYQRNWRMALYWAAAATLTACITY